MSSLAQARCRNPSCNNHEDGATQFKKCARCKLARYCSRECQLADWPLHKLMCNANRSIIDENGQETLATEVVQQMERDLAPTSHNISANSSLSPALNENNTTTQSTPQSNRVFLEFGEVSDDEVMQQTLERLQINTNIFYADQYEKLLQQLPNGSLTATKLASGVTLQPQELARLPKGFMFIQSEEPVSEFRWVLGGPPTLDRGFVVYFMTRDEFFNDVIPQHPNNEMKQKRFKQNLQSLLDTASPREDIVTVGVFGDGQVITFKSELTPYDTLLETLREHPGMFSDGDCVQLFIDRN